MLRGRSSWPVAASVSALLMAGLVTGCTSSGSLPPARATTPGTGGTAGARAGGAPVKRCGTAHTAAGVPVNIEVERGSVACSQALKVERDYAHDLASGKVPGNGGGAPVTVRGWVCQGFNTPEVLATGNASACHKGHAELLAVLPAPATTPPS